jgi:hypothetical protein
MMLGLTWLLPHPRPHHFGKKNMVFLMAVGLVAHDIGEVDYVV